MPAVKAGLEFSPPQAALVHGAVASGAFFTGGGNNGTPRAKYWRIERLADTAYIFEALGCEFDVDVASPGAERTPWIPARSFISRESLNVEWRGFAWMNPPFGGRGELESWLKKFCEHSDGIALVPDRTSAPWWQRYAPRADLILFVAPKIKFLDVNETPGKWPAQGTSLLAIGERGCAALERAAERGLGILMRPEPSRRLIRPSTAQGIYEVAPITPAQLDFFEATA